MPTQRHTLKLHIPLSPGSMSAMNFDANWREWKIVPNIAALGGTEFSDFYIELSDAVSGNIELIILGDPDRSVANAAYPNESAEGEGYALPSWLSSKTFTFRVLGAPQFNGYVPDLGYEWSVDVEVTTPDYFYWSTGTGWFAAWQPGGIYFPVLLWNGVFTFIGTHGDPVTATAAYRFVTALHENGNAPKVTKTNLLSQGEIVTGDVETTAPNAPIVFVGWQVFRADEPNEGLALAPDGTEYSGSPPYFVTGNPVRFTLPEGNYTVRCIVIDEKGFGGSYLTEYVAQGVQEPIHVDTSVRIYYDRSVGVLYALYKTFERWEEGYEDFLGFGTVALYQLRMARQFQSAETLVSPITDLSDTSGAAMEVITTDQFARRLGRHGANLEAATSSDYLYNSPAFPPKVIGGIVASGATDEDFNFISRAIMAAALRTDGSKILFVSTGLNVNTLERSIYRDTGLWRGSDYRSDVSFEKNESLTAAMLDHPARMLRIAGGYLLFAKQGSGVAFCFSQDDLKTWTEPVFLSADAAQLLGAGKGSDDSHAFALLKTGEQIVRVRLFCAAEGDSLSWQTQNAEPVAGLPDAAQIFLPADLDCDGVTSYLLYLHFDEAENSAQFQLATSQDNGLNWVHSNA